MRVFTTSLATGTNTFAPMPTSSASFKDRAYFAAGKHPDAMTLFSGPIWAARMRGADKGGCRSSANFPQPFFQTRTPCNTLFSGHCAAR